MNRLRRAAPALFLGLGLLSGCSGIGNGQILHRLGIGSHAPACPCDTCGSGPVVYEGPDLGGGCVTGGPMILGPTEVPNLAPPPQRLPGQAIPVPADPASQVKSR